MTIKTVEGIVINEVNYSESSKVLTVLTKDDGILSIMSKGCRKIKSTLRSLSSRLSYANFDIYYKKDGMSTLVSANPINLFKNILMDYKDLAKISYSLFLIELSSQIIKEKHISEEDIKEVYKLLITGLIKIDEGFNPSIISNIIELKYLDYLGVKPSIDGCSNCGSDLNIVTITPESFGFICKDCYNGEKLVNEKMLKMIRMLYYVDISKISKLDIDKDIVKEVNSFIDQYYDIHTGLYLKTKQNLKNLYKLDVIAS